MSVSPGFTSMLEEVLSPLGRISVRRMFGGGGVYCSLAPARTRASPRDGVMFGLVADDVLYLKADAATKAAFENEGCGPFVYDGKGKPIAMSYWRVPDRLYDEPEELVAWSRIAFGVALKSKSGVKAKAKRR